jgi:hypothetical protein
MFNSKDFYGGRENDQGDKELNYYEVHKLRCKGKNENSRAHKKDGAKINSKNPLDKAH